MNYIAPHFRFFPKTTCDQMVTNITEMASSVSTMIMMVTLEMVIIMTFI